MPSLWHDSGNELFKDDPEFARRLFRLAGVELPPDVQLIPAPTNETDRTLSNDLDPDTVLVAGSIKRPKRIIIVELQQAWDPGKLRQWPRYAASKWLRYQAVRWCAGLQAGGEGGRGRARPERALAGLVLLLGVLVVVRVDARVQGEAARPGLPPHRPMGADKPGLLGVRGQGRPEAAERPRMGVRSVRSRPRP
jgi:hypothetical protein